MVSRHRQVQPVVPGAKFWRKKSITGYLALVIGSIACYYYISNFIFFQAYEEGKALDLPEWRIATLEKDLDVKFPRNTRFIGVSVISVQGTVTKAKFEIPRSELDAFIKSSDFSDYLREKLREEREVTEDDRRLYFYDRSDDEWMDLGSVNRYIGEVPYIVISLDHDEVATVYMLR